MIIKIKERFLMWLVGWAMLIDGIAVVLSVGFLSPVPRLALIIAKYLARWRMKNTLKQAMNMDKIVVGVSE